MATIILGISSGIAAFKAVTLTELLLKKGHTVHVMMTDKASYLVSPGKLEELTGNPVSIHLFDEHFSYEEVLKRRKVDHIELAKKADLMVIAPATANTIAKIAIGIADDFITTTLLATDSPVLICPSMNDRMWYHPATVHNLEKIKSFGYDILTPATGSLACGTDGIGRLPEPESIVENIEKMLSRSQKLKGKKVLVTGGGTMEPIDDVRVITNRGSGKMGKALAEICFRYGADVTFLHSRNAVKSHLPIKQESFSTSNDLSKILAKEVVHADIVFHTAAVSDFSTEMRSGKIESNVEIILNLKPTPKIINEMKKLNPKVLLIGFKAVHHAAPSHSREGGNPIIESTITDHANKLFTDANTDLVVVNDVSRNDIGFESDENEVYVVDKNQNVTKINKASKSHIAEDILKIIL